MCGVCTAALEPIDWLLESKPVLHLGEWIAKQICIEEGIEGGIPSVC